MTVAYWPPGQYASVARRSRQPVSRPVLGGAPTTVSRAAANVSVADPSRLPLPHLRGHHLRGHHLRGHHLRSRQLRMPAHYLRLQVSRHLRLLVFHHLRSHHLRPAWRLLAVAS